MKNKISSDFSKASPSTGVGGWKGPLIKRKEFIQVGSLATASMLVPKFLKAFEQRPLVPLGNKVVVILQLSGGNDGLNTVIPVRNDIYYKERPRLGIARTKALSLTDEAGLHPSLTAFKEMYDDGSLAILNSVGYPNPDRSHFRSMDIWHSASPSNEYWNTGWVGRYLDAQCKGCPQGPAGNKPTHAIAIELDDVLSLALKGDEMKGIAMKDPRRLFGTANEKFFRDVMKHHHDEPGEQPVDYLYKTMAETLSSADYIFKHSKTHPTNAEYPKTELGNSLKTIASLIYSEINTKVYYVSLGRFEDVLLFTFSEFGRSVKQNASNGTDHGTANNMFLISGGLKQKGLINPLPDLTNLDDGDLKYKVDFKNVYATVLNKWLKANDEQILTKQYNYLNFI